MEEEERMGDEGIRWLLSQDIHGLNPIAYLIKLANKNSFRKNICSPICWITNLQIGQDSV